MIKTTAVDSNRATAVVITNRSEQIYMMYGGLAPPIVPFAPFALPARIGYNGFL
jgi:hypothetical protein